MQNAEQDFWAQVSARMLRQLRREGRRTQIKMLGLHVSGVFRTIYKLCYQEALETYYDLLKLKQQRRNG